MSGGSPKPPDADTQKRIHQEREKSFFNNPLNRN